MTQIFTTDIHYHKLRHICMPRKARVDHSSSKLTPVNAQYGDYVIYIAIKIAKTNLGKMEKRKKGFAEKNIFFVVELFEMKYG